MDDIATWCLLFVVKENEKGRNLLMSLPVASYTLPWAVATNLGRSVLVAPETCESRSDEEN